MWGFVGVCVIVNSGDHMHFICKVGTIIGSEDCILSTSPHKHRSKNVCVQDRQHAEEHSFHKSRSMHFFHSLHSAATCKHKFILLYGLISSTGNYYLSLFHSSGRVVAQLDEYLI